MNWTQNDHNDLNDLNATRRCLEEIRNLLEEMCDHVLGPVRAIKPIEAEPGTSEKKDMAEKVKALMYNALKAAITSERYYKHLSGPSPFSIESEAVRRMDIYSKQIDALFGKGGT